MMDQSDPRSTSSSPVIVSSFPYSNAKKPTALSGKDRAVDLHVGQEDGDITKRRRDDGGDSSAARPSHRSERWPATCWH